MSSESRTCLALEGLSVHVHQHRHLRIAGMRHRRMGRILESMSSNCANNSGTSRSRVKCLGTVLSQPCIVLSQSVSGARFTLARILSPRRASSGREHDRQYVRRKGHRRRWAAQTFLQCRRITVTHRGEHHAPVYDSSVPRYA